MIVPTAGFVHCTGTSRLTELVGSVRPQVLDSLQVTANGSFPRYPPGREGRSGAHTLPVAANCVTRPARQLQGCRRGRSRLHTSSTRAQADNGDVSAQASSRGVSEACSEGVQLPTHLNTIPHSRTARQFFYQDAAAAMQAAIQSDQHRVHLRCTIPELNPAMDVYRIGTLLELARELASCLAQDGDHVKVCVQQSLGQGVFMGLPLSLSGVRRIMEAMDWGDIADFVHFGEVGSDQIDDCRYYVLIAPQNVVGSTIMTNLGEMVSAAEDRGKFLVLINPILKDIPSADAVMGIRGRKERTALTNSFQPAYHFRLLYMSSAMMYPIMGALRHCHGGPWEVYKRVQLGKREEEYRLVATFEEEPVGAKMTKLFIKG